MEILKKPIKENCVWKVSDFKNENEWTYEFSEDEILELENAASQIIKKNLAPTSFSKKDFELNKLENVPSKMIDELKASNLNFTIELGRSIGWKNYLGSITKSFSIDEFGISAPIKDLKEEYKFTAKNIGDEIKKYLD